MSRRLGPLLVILGASGCGSKTGLLADEPNSDAVAPDAGCDAGGTIALAHSKSRFFFLMDKSGSMLGERWAAAAQAMQNLFADSRSTGLFVALNFFPFKSICDPGPYLDPRVPFGKLSSAPAPQDTHEEQLLAALAAVVPEGATPYAAPIEGALTYMTAQPLGGGLGRLELVLISDGDPSGCNPSELATAIDLVKDARSGPSKVVTHAIGIGPDAKLETISQLADAGDGTAILVEANDKLDSLLYDALIKTTRTCTFALPASTANVALVGKNGETTALERVVGPGACEQSPFGWYPDALNHDVAVLCPVACDRAAEDGVEVIATCPVG